MFKRPAIAAIAALAMAAATDAYPALNGAWLFDDYGEDFIRACLVSP